jgi:uncharacterized cupredoxin-like copper-binding protein
MRAPSRTTRITTLLAAGLLTVAAAACGDTPTETTPSMSPSDMDMNGDHESFAFGEPADATDADRTIEIEAQDIMYDITEVEVAVDETITFVVTNTGAIVHEFVIGDSATQDEHESEMEMESGMPMQDEPNAISIEPGETKELTWHFTQAGEVLYGCHEPGHYDAGMVGTITVTE